MVNLQTIIVDDVTNPTEVSTWLTNNPSITLITAEIHDNIFYLFWS